MAQHNSRCTANAYNGTHVSVYAHICYSYERNAFIVQAQNGSATSLRWQHESWHVPVHCKLGESTVHSFAAGSVWYTLTLVSSASDGLYTHSSTVHGGATGALLLLREVILA
jgi:hypothetical protein